MVSPPRRVVCCVRLGAIALLLAGFAPGADVPTPASVLGFQPGADGKLVTWSSVADYLERVDRASDRVRVEKLGETTEGRSFLVVTVSDESTMADLPRFKALQRSIADPRTIPSPEGEHR